jgi:hypothetical protein
MKRDLASIPFGRTVLMISEKKQPRRIFGQEKGNREIEKRPRVELQIYMWLDLSESLN